MAGWYELSKSPDGQFHFVLKAGNGETILSSERYKAHASAMNGMASVQKNSPDASRYEKNSVERWQAVFHAQGGQSPGHWQQRDVLVGCCT